MGRRRGISLKHRVAAIFPSPAQRRKLCGVIGWAHKVGLKVKSTLAQAAGGKYKRDPVLGKPVPVPKGQMAVYVGQSDGAFERILVPVVYFNHPLFGDLLKESENEFGFNQPGGITIPCRVAEFERVQTRIKTGRKTLSLPL
ncbi:auxin-responsive protein SAUR36-like [Salvia hispanica]|uniref:auxin-responsive protein SAUR36-like n=1 Tax=Salvia hispanica TaxID=49212 RepID=UPI0020098D14|nr:auxin-responsive protein SAUR36-like [Salvia hispanica]